MFINHDDQTIGIGIPIPGWVDGKKLTTVATGPALDNFERDLTVGEFMSDYGTYFNPWNPNIPLPVDGLDHFLNGAQKTTIIITGSAVGGIVIIGGGALVGVPGMAALAATKLTLGGVVLFVAKETGELIVESVTGVPVILGPDDIAEWISKGLLKKGAKEGTYALTKAGLKHADELVAKATKGGTWPSAADKMDDLLGVQGRKIPDGPTTPGRDKTVWQPNADTKITFERHPYHPDAPDWHRDYDWHLDTPNNPHQRFVPGDDIPGMRK
jgi:hypothetical protein